MPMQERRTSFASASAAIEASASRSLLAAGSASRLLVRIDAGTAAATSASSVAWPRTRSMDSTSAASGPMWRSANRSCVHAGRTACSGRVSGFESVPLMDPLVLLGEELLVRRRVHQVVEVLRVRLDADEPPRLPRVLREDLEVVLDLRVHLDDLAR